MRAALVPLDQGEASGISAPEVAAKSIRAHDDLDFEPWWRQKGEFDFGDVRYIDGISVWPWLHHWTHHLDADRLVVIPRSDFVRYHALESRLGTASKTEIEYRHLLDQTIVLRTDFRRVAYYKPMPFSQVQSDYLRDFLAARRTALILAIVADRFAHANSVEELQLNPLEQHQIDDNTWITTTIHDKSPFNIDLAMGRSSLYWNLIIGGYDKPKESRNPWSFSYQPQDLDELPSFLVENGKRVRASDPQCPFYLYFSPYVLRRFRDSAGYGAGFHMRTWGGVSTPFGSVDVGLNSRGLINAFMPDIAKLPVSEQQHWAVHSVLPDGEVCAAMFETRMQLNPPDLPGVIGLLSGAMETLERTFRKQYQVDLFGTDTEVPPESSGPLSIGPLGDDAQEVAELSVPLYAWVVESMQITSLRTPLVAHSIAFDVKSRQIVLLRTLLIQLKGITHDDATTLTAPLAAINELRAKAAHVAKLQVDPIVALLGLSTAPVNARALWDALIDRTAQSLQKIAALIEAS